MPRRNLRVGREREGRLVSGVRERDERKESGSEEGRKRYQRQATGAKRGTPSVLTIH
jgi:hypothetical protein